MQANIHRWLLVAALPLVVALGCGRAEQIAHVEPPRSEVEQGPVRLAVQFDPAAPALADRPTLSVTVDREAGVTVERPEFGPRFGDFRVVDAREEMPRVENDREIVEWVYTLEPIQAGRSSIWPVDVAYTDTSSAGDGKRHLISSKPLAVEVATTVETDAPTLDGLKAEASPVALPFSRLAMYCWTAVILAAVAATAGLVYWRRTHKKAIATRPPTPAEIAYGELRKIAEDALAERDVKLFYVAVTGVVRRFIERTTLIRAPEQTTEEFLHEISVRKTFPAEENLRLKNFLEAADLVKFAAHRPRGEDVDATLDRAKDFIDARQTAMDAADAVAHETETVAAGEKEMAL